MKTMMISLAGAALIATPAVAGPKHDGQAAAPAQAKAKSDPNRMICRTIESTGSRLRKERQCMSAADWAVLNAQNRRDVERGQSNRPLNSPGG